jgi:type IV secretion system protein VirD4
VNPDDLHRLRPVLSLFFQQAIGLQTRELPERNPRLKHQVMMLFDEFTALGRIPIMAEAISYLPGYNVRVVVVIQTPAQLREVYGANAAETMLKSLAARVVFAPKDYSDAREISDELGFTTVSVRSVSRPRFNLFEAKRRSGSVSVSEQRRALLLPQEVKELGTEEALILYEGLPPIRCRKIRYYQDPRFAKRLCAPPPIEPRQHVVCSPPARSRSAAAPPSADEASSHTVATREARIEDLERVETLTLDDFAADFSDVKVPAEGRMSDHEMQQAVDSFLASLRTN